MAYINQMNRLLMAVLAVGVVSYAAVAEEEPYSYSFTNTVNQPIPDDGSVLSSQMEVSGLSGFITNIQVGLNITGGYNGDIFGYLRFESSFTTNIAVLLNRVGRASANDYGYADTGFLITLSDLADTDIHVYQTVGYPESLNEYGQLTGHWQPDGRAGSPGYGLTGDARLALLGSFNGYDPNGTWTLVLADMVSGSEQSTLVNWNLEIQMIPEPTTIALAVLGAILLVLPKSRCLRAGLVA